MSHLCSVAQLREATRAAPAVGGRTVREPSCARIVVLRQAANVGGTTNLAIPWRSANFVRSATWLANTGSGLGRATQLISPGRVRLGSVQLASATRIGPAFGPAQVGGAHCCFRKTFQRHQRPDVGLGFGGLLLIAAGRS